MRICAGVGAGAALASAPAIITGAAGAATTTTTAAAAAAVATAATAATAVVVGSATDQPTSDCGFMIFFSAGQLGSQFFKGLNAWRPARRAAPLAPAQDLFKHGSRMQPANADSTKTSPRIISTRMRASLLVSLMRHPRPRAAAAGDAPSEKRLRCRA